MAFNSRGRFSVIQAMSSSRVSSVTAGSGAIPER
jgi:hypothetical protein